MTNKAIAPVLHSCNSGAITAYNIFMEEGIDSDVGGRKNVINGINKTLKHLEDDEMVELSLCVLAKLKELTDHEFMKMEFVAAE